jgi:hypothetical protein
MLGKVVGAPQSILLTGKCNEEIIVLFDRKSGAGQFQIMEVPLALSSAPL